MSSKVIIQVGTDVPNTEFSHGGSHFLSGSVSSWFKAQRHRELQIKI